LAFGTEQKDISAAAPGAVWSLCNGGNICVRNGFDEIETFGTSWEEVESADGNAI
jgi:hypothetical protein